MSTPYFFGEYEHALDAQRRLSIPSGWKNKGKNELFFLIPGRQTLQLIPYEIFSDFIEKARKVSFANAKASLAFAQFASQVQECKLDKQGRIQISQKLLDHARIKDQITLVGAVTSIQLWAPDEWEKLRNQDTEKSLDEIQRIGEVDENIATLLQSVINQKGNLS